MGHTIRHNEFVVNILEGEISGKKTVGRPGPRYLKQVARSTGADSYTAMKRMACNNFRWKSANQPIKRLNDKKKKNENSVRAKNYIAGTNTTFQGGPRIACTLNI